MRTHCFSVVVSSFAFCITPYMIMLPIRFFSLSCRDNLVLVSRLLGLIVQVSQLMLWNNVCAMMDGMGMIIRAILLVFALLGPLS